LSLFYLSYCEPAGWKGAAFVEAETLVAASKRADEEGISPGGNDVQMLSFQYEGLPDVPEVPDEKRNRLLGKDELLAFWPDAKEVMEYDDHVG
jgi:hypothetical protein